MAEDKREAILARLAEVYAGIDGIKKAFRNSLDIPEKDQPAIAMMDADEGADDEGTGTRPALSPVIMVLTPETYLILSAKSKDIGSDLNALRVKVIKAVLTDQVLLSLVKDSDIRYLGFATSLAAGRSMEGEAGISFQFRYVLHPSKL